MIKVYGWCFKPEAFKVNHWIAWDPFYENLQRRQINNFKNNM